MCRADGPFSGSYHSQVREQLSLDQTAYSTAFNVTHSAFPWLTRLPTVRRPAPGPGPASGVRQSSTTSRESPVESRKGARPGPTGSRWFPFPAHRTGHADFPHPALRQTSPQAHGSRPRCTSRTGLQPSGLCFGTSPATGAKTSRYPVGSRAGCGRSGGYCENYTGCCAPADGCILPIGGRLEADPRASARGWSSCLMVMRTPPTIVLGRLPEMFGEAGFQYVQEVCQYQTLVTAPSLFQASKV